MQIELLKNIVASVAGKNAVELVDLLHEKKNVNEFFIAKKLNMTINQTRTVLYKLADEGLVSFIRKKDSKKGGWYTYFWTLNSGKSLIKFRSKLLKDLDSIKSQIGNRSAKRFFYCPNCDIEYNEENALSHDYVCPECGEVLLLKDNAAEIANLQKDADRINKVLSEINAEISTISKKDEKDRARKFRAEAKKKEKERLLKKKERQRLVKVMQKNIKKNKKIKKSKKKKKAVRRKRK